MKFESKRLDRIFREVKQTIPASDCALLTPSVVHGVVPQSKLENRPQQAFRDGYEVYPAQPGDFVISMSSFRHGFEYCAIPGGISPDYTVLRPLFDEAVGRFLRYSLKSDVLTQQLTLYRSGIRQGQRLQWNRIRYLRIPVPTKEDAEIVAAYLDAETARIDTLIEKKERFRSSLTSKRLQTILDLFKQHRCPETALDPQARRAFATGDGWSLQRVKHLVSFMTSGSRGWSELIADEGELFLQSGNIGRRMEVDLRGAQRITPQTGSEARRTLVKAGDVLVCITGGRTGAVGYLPAIGEAGYVNQHVCLLRPRPRVIEPELLAHLLFSDLGQRQFELLQYGLKQGLGFAQVGEVRLPVPPRHAQGQILDLLHARLARDDRVEGLLNASIDRLREFRAALVTAAVTGQIDLADWSRRGKNDRRLEAIERDVA